MSFSRPSTRYFIAIDELPITLIGAPQLLAALRRIEDCGKHETAHLYARNAEKCSGTPSQPAAPSAIRLLTFGVHSRPSSVATIPSLPSRPRSVSCCEP
jgi:hypothetical protein